MASDWYDKCTVAIGVTMLNVMLGVGLIQVLNRYYTLPIDLYWTYEVARTLLGLMTIIAIPYLFKNNSDISFLPVLQRITTRTDTFLLGRNILVGFLAIAFIWSAYLASGTAGDQGLPMIGWFKVRWAYLLFGVSSALLFVVILTDTKERLQRILGGTDV